MNLEPYLSEDLTPSETRIGEVAWKIYRLRNRMQSVIDKSSGRSWFESAAILRDLRKISAKIHELEKGVL